MDHINTQAASPYEGRPWTRRYDYWVPRDVGFPSQSIYQALNLSALHYRDKDAVAFLGSKMSFHQLKREADQLAAALTGLGISKGDRVGVMLPNCPQYLISFYPKNLPYTKERYHSIRVDLTRRDLRALTRSGYYGDTQ